MPKTDRVQARIEPELKASAESVLSRLGLSPTEAIRLFYKQIDLRQGLPFELRLPNEETLQALRDLDERHELLTHETLEDFKRSLEL